MAIFNGCLQDDSNAGNVVLYNTVTGEYRYCCAGQVISAGTGIQEAAAQVAYLSRRALLADKQLHHLS